jgi:hypothetical protein
LQYLFALLQGCKKKKPSAEFRSKQSSISRKEETMKNTRRSPITRFGMIAVLAVTALLTVAHAQSLPPAPQTRIDNLHAGNGAGLSSDQGIRQDWSVGWNYVHPQNCTLYYSGGYAYLIVYPKEGGYFWTTASAFQALIDPACQTGNWLAFYVYDDSGDWSQVWTYTFK